MYDEDQIDQTSEDEMQPIVKLSVTIHFQDDVVQFSSSKSHDFHSRSRARIFSIATDSTARANGVSNYVCRFRSS